MQPSDRAHSLIKFYEASNVCRLKAYLDTGGVPTIGWGTTMYPDGRRVKMGDVCTEREADSFLKADLKFATKSVCDLVTVDISQFMFDALVSFVYNIGVGQFKSSTMLKLINAGSFELANQQFARWVYDNGKIQPGLVKRRVAERSLFQEGMLLLASVVPASDEQEFEVAASNSEDKSANLTKGKSKK